MKCASQLFAIATLALGLSLSAAFAASPGEPQDIAFIAKADGTTQRYVEVELTGGLTRGMTLMDQRSWMAEGGPVQWAQTIDAVAATNLILDSIAAAP